ncbi:hypothetical protein DL93DRAFT_740134 [Clavulina sp. PMI_390]|nr:hypothetical protein DL93DRAFT_740134 [Clavulina sp. PMI_390]
MSKYDIVIERIGKGQSPFREAKHRVTIQDAQPLARFCPKNQLLLGLFEATPAERENSAQWSWITELNQTDWPSWIDAPAFVTQLDEKWRGNPAALAHVARFLQHIVESAPRYNITSTNCYYFSRLLVHAIALRHYSFGSVVRPSEPHDIRSLRRDRRLRETDESTTLIVFLTLEAQHESYGIVAYHLVFWFVGYVIYLGTFFIVASTGITNLRSIRWYGGVLVSLLIAVVCLLLWDLVSRFLMWKIIRSLRAQTSGLISALDEDITLTHPRSRRGPYHTSREMELHVNMRAEGNGAPPWPRVGLLRSHCLIYLPRSQLFLH